MRKDLIMDKYLAYEQLKEKGFELYGHAPAYGGAGTEEVLFSLDVYRSYYVYEHDAKENDFLAYCKKLEENNFELFAKKQVNGNLFATYTDGENIVNVSYISYIDVDRYVVRDMSYVLISVDSTKNSVLPCKCEAFEEITAVSVSVVNMLTIIIKLLDGRFLVIDGSVYSNTDHIYDELCKQNVRDGKPVVAAWMFSHAHGDHVGGFIGILEKYADKVDVQSVIHNFPGEHIYGNNQNYMEGMPNREGDYMTDRSNKIHRLMGENMPSGKFAIAHAGQTFEYPGVKLEVLMTSENIYKTRMFDTNMSSVVYMLTMPGGKMLALGDAVDAESKLLRRIYGKALKCDAVVLAHHAYNGGDEEMYHYAGAKAAIWSHTYEEILNKDLIGNFTNHFDFNSAKYNFIMSSGDAAMTLYADMSEDEIARFARKADVKSPAPVDYEARQNPKVCLTKEHLEKGFGNAPRYYGTGEDTQVLTVNEAEKSYTVTVEGVSEYDFDYYRNSLKRDGYWPKEKIETEDAIHTVYVSPDHTVLIDYLKNSAKIVVTVGRVGKDILVY